MDLLKLREFYKKTYRNNKFSFFHQGHEYTTTVINVNFEYSNKLYNHVRKDTYVKFGYDISDIKFIDHICVINNEVIAIETNQEVKKPSSEDILDKYFYYDAEKKVYKAKGNIKTLNTISELRKSLYDNGFYCNGTKYVRFKRSNGSSRIGKCLFVDERLYSRMHKWEMCGIKIREGDEIDLAALEAYIALTISSIIDTIEIDPKSILVIDDWESTFTDEVIESKLDDTHIVSRPNIVTLKNSIWDGQSLLDSSMFKKYKRGMLLLRNSFFKSCCFNTNIQKWFKDNNITKISQLNGFTLAEKVEDIKLITTPSSIKYLKFGTLQQWLENVNSVFGIVKHEKPTHNFDGHMVKTHYQLLNTLQLSMGDMEKFLQPSLEYLDLLKSNPAVLRYHIGFQHNLSTKASTPLLSKNDIIYKLLGINDKFAETKLYYDFKTDIVKSYIKNLRFGHVLVHGNYSTLFGNPVEMLLHSIGMFDGVSQLGIGNIHSSFFEYDQQLLGSRSPHVTMGNVWLSTNVKNQNIDTYFNLTKEIVCVNSIGESLLDRLSGSDQKRGRLVQ